MLIVHDPRCHNYSAELHPESPLRVSRTVEHLRHQTELVIQWEIPLEATDTTLLRAHSPEHLRSVREAARPFSEDSPNYPGILDHAKRSVGGALRAMEAARQGQTAFSLMRPPGHHATRDEAMGFCYLNSIAAAALEALAQGEKRVAIFDFDIHHGNGTEAIVLNHSQIDFFSVHQYPCYPGTGQKDVGKNCFNYPVARHTPHLEHRGILTRALNDLKRKHPSLIAVSAGFDAYKGDPLADGMLEKEDFFWLGSELKSLSLPCFAILEGGYSKELPLLIDAFLHGLES